MLRALILAVLVAVLAGCFGAAVSPASCAGAVLGAVLGGAVSLVSMARVRRALARHSERAMTALVEGFLLKLVMLGLAIAAFHAWDGFAARFEWRAFLLAFGTAAIAVLFAAVYEFHQSRVGASTRTVEGTKGRAA
jgi:hypothetical protein